MPVPEERRRVRASPPGDSRGSDDTAARPRIFSSQLAPAERRIYGAVTALFLTVFLATMWPVYPWFSRVRPIILGVPFSMFFLLVLVAVSFAALMLLYRWEDRRGKLG